MPDENILVELIREATKGLREDLKQSQQEFLTSLKESSDAKQEALVEAVKEIKIDVPEPKVDVKVEQPEVNVPPVEVPTVNVPEPKVTVNVPDVVVPEIKVPSITVPKIEVPDVNVNIPDVMSVSGDVGLRDVDSKNPLPVILTGSDGKPMLFPVGGGGGRVTNPSLAKSDAIIGTVRDFITEVALGNIPGYSYINKFGRNPDIDTTSDPEDVWDGGGLWTPPTSAKIHDINSSSANDAGTVLSSGTVTADGGLNYIIDSTADFVADGVAVGDTVINDTNLEHSTVTVVETTRLTMHTVRHRRGFNEGDTYRVVTPASTGASILHVIGLDSNMLEAEEFIVMNGATSVETTREYWRIHRAHIDGAATRANTNVGNITMTAQSAATVTAQITATRGQTLMAIYTIPAGKVGLMTNFYASMNRGGGASALCDISLIETPFASIDGAGSRTKHFTGLSMGGTSAKQHNFMPYKTFLEQTDIILRCEETSVNDLDVSGGFDLILKDV